MLVNVICQLYHSLDLLEGHRRCMLWGGVEREEREKRWGQEREAGRQASGTGRRIRLKRKKKKKENQGDCEDAKERRERRGQQT